LNLYANFKNYGSKGYDAANEGLNEAKANAQKVVGFVKYRMEKYLKVFQFILAMAMPQWNRVPRSPEDLNTNAHTVIQSASVDNENLKYNMEYSSIRFRY